MPLQFPVSPSLNQIFDIGGKAYIWNGSSWTAWTPPASNNNLTVFSSNNNVSVYNPSQMYFGSASVTGSGNTANVLFTGSGPQFLGTFVGDGSTGGGVLGNISVPSGVNFIEIHVNGVQAVNAGGRSWILQINGDEGFNYFYHGRTGTVASNSDIPFNVDGDQVLQMLGQINGSGTNTPTCGTIYLSNLQNTLRIGVGIKWGLSWTNFNFGQESLSSGEGYYKTTSPITNILLSPMQGLFQFGAWNGKFSAWGWPND